MEQLVDGGQEPSDDDHARLNDARSRLPNSGRFHIECIGLKAAEHKRLAELEFKLARQKVNSKQPRHENLERCHRPIGFGLVGVPIGSGDLPGSHRRARPRTSQPTLAGRSRGIAGYRARIRGPRGGADVQPSSLLPLPLTNKDRADRVWSHVSLAELSLLQLGIEFKRERAR